MKPARFRYERPATLAEAVDSLARWGGDAKVLAGGQSLVPLLNMRLVEPPCLIDLNRVAELDAFSEDEDGRLRIAALVRQRALEDHPLAARCPLLGAAAAHVGHPATRNRGTVCGSVAHADPAAELPAALAALEGEIVIAGPRGERRARPDEFFLSVLTTSLAPDEIVTAVRVPVLPPGTGWAFEEFSVRHGDFALVGVACTVALDGRGAVAEARIALAGAGPVPMRARRTEALLRGATPGEEVAREAAAEAAREIEPESDLHAGADYRRALARVLVRNAVLRAAARAGQTATRGERC